MGLLAGEKGQLRGFSVSLRISILHFQVHLHLHLHHWTDGEHTVVKTELLTALLSTCCVVFVNVSWCSSGGEIVGRDHGQRRGGRTRDVAIELGRASCSSSSGYTADPPPPLLLPSP